MDRRCKVGEVNDKDWRELWNEVEIVCSRFTLNTDSRWHDDLRSCAAETLHENWYSHPARRRLIAKQRIIDRWRNIVGRKETSFHRRLDNAVRLDQPLPDGDGTIRDLIDEGDHDTYPCLTDRELTLFELVALFDKPQHRLIARGLAFGRLKQDIAADLGVHPARVSQLIAEMRYTYNSRTAA